MRDTDPLFDEVTNTICLEDKNRVNKLTMQG